jgi:protein-S-isoprenylcysteine O-methyltransferase Ste14
VTDLHTALAWAVIGVAVPTLVYLMWVTAPYGRHARSGWGPVFPARVGWVVMESPAVLFWLWVYAQGVHRAELVPLVFLAMWQLHYVNRTFVFPLRFRKTAHPVPVAVAAMGFTFNCVNAWLNATQVAHLGDYPTSWLTTPWFLVGAAMFFGGMAINWYADTVLIRLRAPGETGYRIPYGGPYRLVSCPNYMGEMLEWAGWAVATASLAGASFFVFTVANLLPRALAHHRWYRRTFADYPPERAAVIPYLL